LGTPLGLADAEMLKRLAAGQGDVEAAVVRRLAALAVPKVAGIRGS
jgi:hypothetical protein